MLESTQQDCCMLQSHLVMDHNPHHGKIYPFQQSSSCQFLSHLILTCPTAFSSSSGLSSSISCFFPYHESVLYHEPILHLGHVHLSLSDQTPLHSSTCIANEWETKGHLRLVLNLKAIS